MVLGKRRKRETRLNPQRLMPAGIVLLWLATACFFYFVPPKNNLVISLALLLLFLCLFTPAFLSTTKEERAVVLYQDVKSLDIKPGDGVEVRRLRFGEALRPADYLEKKEEGIGEERKEKKLMSGGEIAFG